jgi:hypothetical protein
MYLLAEPFCLFICCLVWLGWDSTQFQDGKNIKETLVQTGDDIFSYMRIVCWGIGKVLGIQRQPREIWFECFFTKQARGPKMFFLKRFTNPNS